VSSKRSSENGAEADRTVKSSRRPSLKKEELLDRAFEIFVEFGFERASIDVISASIGIAKRTLYLRYGDKESLFRAATERAIERWLLPLTRLADAECEDFEASLLAIGRLLVGNVLNPAGLRLLRLTNAVSGQMPEIGAHNVHKGINPTIAFLAELFRRRLGPRLRCYAEPEEAAFAFMNLVVSGPANLVAWGVRLDDEFVDRYVQSSVCLFVEGLVPDSAEAILTKITQENQRLKLLLADAMLQIDSLRHKRAVHNRSHPTTLPIEN
jgi:TetR/AcrR family transcriptional regulator, mexJK operon transcriptional repressor